MEVVSQYRYTRGKQIDGGEGQNSIGVFEAYDHALTRQVAVKEIDKEEFRKTNGTDGYFEEAQQMFRSGHPNVVAIHTATETKERVLLSMPLYSRGSLAKRIQNTPLSVSEILTVGRQILAGVGAIHAGGTIHFDIKPSNVLFSDSNEAMVADFGQARTVGTHGVTLMPNRMYGPSIPPEAFTSGRRGTRESDVYQVGLTLWRACNGRALFEEELARHGDDDELKQSIIGGKFPKRDLFLPHIPDRLRRAIRKALQVQPNERFRAARDFANALTNVDDAYDWRPQFMSDGGMVWLGEKRDAAKLKLVLGKDADKWGVSLFTRSSGKDRATRKTLWREGLKRGDALRCARELIASLG